MKSKGRYFQIPQNAYPPIEQAAVILKSSHRKQAAQQFLQFLKKPETISLLQQHGFSVAESRK
jgi:molybdate transport system substrate-binding protein